MSARITRKRHAPLQDELRRVVDSLPGLVWTSLPDGYVDFLDQRWCDYTGLSLEKACGWGWNAAIREGVLLRSEKPLAARQQREHERSAAPVFPSRQRPIGLL